MTVYRVELTRRAERDINGIVVWLAERSRQGAKTWVDRLEDVLQSLRATADGCTLAPENDYSDLEVRDITFKTRHGKPYRILFSIVGDVVFVRHVRGPGQDLIPPERLNQPVA